jgi:hypothetical protein
MTEGRDELHSIPGGKNFYGFTIGILTLQTRFPRIPGDMVNATTFPFPVLYRRVDGASPHRVVREGDPALLAPFIQAARELEQEGVRAITTNCGFLAMFQDQLAEAVSIPVFTSSLMQVPLVHRMLPRGKAVGILTVWGKALTDRHLSGAGIGPEIPIRVAGLETEQEFSHVLIDDQPELNPDLARQEHERVARRLVEQYPEIGAFVLECTNMPPYSHDIQRVTGRPVFDIVSLVKWVHGSLTQTPYQGWM